MMGGRLRKSKCVLVDEINDLEPSSFEIKTNNTMATKKAKTKEGGGF